MRGEKRTGKCKWFNVAKGWGFITPDDGSQEVFVHQSVIQMNGFRSLGDNEQVEFECRESEKGLEATLVTGPEGSNCSGSHRRPMKKKVKKIRCYNCGELAHHIASKCNLGPQPKKCHHCKSEDHLIGDCPKRVNKDKENNKNHQDLSSNDDMQSENSSIDLNMNDSRSPEGSNGSTGDFS
ncbi:unnamed protein product [Allacma fusca]|uniref:CSD domain-containing protein n=1 Tax=Allacma fusca TaxID=39272 RepID=A0A8J2KXL1_9HEXA|nr:unnamed protein product [Allacma fusca]